jgi:hypothetical protein
MVGMSATCEGLHGCVDAVAEGDSEHCLKFRSDEIQNGTSCGAKQRQGHAASPLAGAGRPTILVPLPSLLMFPLTGVDWIGPDVRAWTNTAHDFTI